MTLPLWLLKARAFASRIPTWLLIVAGVLALLGLAYVIGKGDGRESEQAEQATVERKALETARKADAAASEATERTKANVEAENQRAREAAAGSDDPLREFANALRNE